MPGKTKTMNRREFFSFAAAGAVTSPAASQAADVNSLTEQIEAAIRHELPGVKTVEITYDPEDERVPLMILVLRV